MNTRDVTWEIYKGEVEQPRLNCRLTFIASCIACRKHRSGESEEGSRDQECVQTANSRQCPRIYHGNLKRCCCSTRWQIDARRICRDNCCVSRPEQLRIERERDENADETPRPRKASQADERATAAYHTIKG